LFALEIAAPDSLRKVADFYLTPMQARAPGAARIVDKMLVNFRYAGLIHLAFPNARIIHAMRDPVDTCLSCFSHSFGEGDVDYSYDLGELGQYYRAYSDLMAHWRAVLPPEVMLEVQYESLVRDFETWARRIVSHCGLGWDDACLFHKSDRIVRTASVSQVRQPVYQTSVGRWRPDIRTLAPLLDALAQNR
jgi:Sulfotransferase family